MSSVTTIPGVDENAPTVATESSRPQLAICLPSMTTEAQQAMQASIAAAFPSDAVLVISPDHELQTDPASPTKSAVFTGHRSTLRWTLAASDYLTAGEVARNFDTPYVLLLNDESVTPEFLHSIVTHATQDNIDLTVPRYALGPHEGLLSAALLYPFSRSLFASDIRFPLPLNAMLSRRAAERLSLAVQRGAGKVQSDTLLWPIAEAATANLSVREFEAGSRSLPQPSEAEFHSLFINIASSLFSDLEAKASFWQRARTLPMSPGRNVSPAPDRQANPADVTPFIDGFRIAYANLLEVWSLVLPPQSLLALKKLSASSPENFQLAPDLWARIAFDFFLAYHLRSMNRGHLLGAFTSLYLAWVASYIHSAGNDPARASLLVEQTAVAFERERPYLLSRWRWPDRFNP